jgi:hypothetical protein
MQKMTTSREALGSLSSSTTKTKQPRKPRGSLSPLDFFPLSAEDDNEEPRSRLIIVFGYFALVV